MKNNEAPWPDSSVAEQALRFYQERERLGREQQDNDAIQQALYGQAQVYIDQGDLAEAQELLERQQDLCRRLGRLGPLATSLETQGRLLTAVPGHSECRRNASLAKGEEVKQLLLLVEMALNWSELGLSLAALTLMEETTNRCRVVGEPVLLAQGLVDQAVLHGKRSEVDVAVRLFEEADFRYGAFSLVGQDVREPRATMLHRYAALLEQSGEYEKSLSMLTDEENLRRELEDRPGLQSCYNEQFRTFQLKDDDEMALAVAGKQETLAREMSDQRLVRLALERQLYLLEKLGDADGARSALIELVQCAREESDSEALMLYLSKEMRFLTQLRRWAEARDSALEYRNLAIESGASDQANKADQLLQQIRVVVDSELPSQAGQESSDSEEFKGDADDLKSVRDQDSDDQPETADSEMPTMSFDEHIQELRQLLNVVPPVWFALTIVAFFLLPQDGLLERMLTAIAWTAIPAYLLWCVQMWRFCAEGLTGKEAFGLAAGLLVTPGVLLALSRAALLPDYVWKVAFDIPMRDSWTLGWGKLAAIFIIVGLCSANVIYALLLSKKLKDKQSSWNSRRSRSLNEIQMGIKLAAQSGVIGALVVIAAPAAVVSAFLLPLQAYLVILSGKSLIR